MKKIWNFLRPALTAIIIFTLICGVIYPLIVTGVAQLAFHNKSNGSIITVTLKDGTKKNYGSKLIAQEFTKSEYLIGRPQEVSNLSPTSDKLQKLIEERTKWWQEFDPENKNEIPKDLLLASGSGFDPNISKEAAKYQAARIAKARNISESDVLAIISKYTTKSLLGIFGEDSVNVLMVNLALDRLI